MAGVKLPTDAEILDRATLLGLVGEDGAVGRADRRRVINLLVEESRKPESSEATGVESGRLLIKNMSPLGDGFIVVEVRYFGPEGA